MQPPAVFDPPVLTLGDLLERLGGVSPERVRFDPIPGTAQADELLSLEKRQNRLYELVDGVIVERVPNYRGAVLAGAVSTALRTFVIPRKLGLVSGGKGAMRLAPGVIRCPHVAFVSNERLPDWRVPHDPIPALAPDLAVEVVCGTNTHAEMKRKRKDYFDAGVRLLWQVDVDAETVGVYTALEERQFLTRKDHLDGGSVLPGFTLNLNDLFAELEG